MMDSSTNYRFLTFINGSVVDHIGWRLPIQFFYSFEVFMLFTNFIEYLYTFYLLLRFRAMHSNLHILLLLYGGQYFFSMISRLFLVYFQFNGSESIDESTFHSLLYTANYTRTICLFVAFNMLPFLVFERCFATCLSGTYETDRNFWIPLILISIMMPVCVLSAVAYIRNWFPIYAHCILLIVLNIGGSLLLIIVTRCNIRLHNSYSTLEHHGLYSLSERFQVSENIKTCQWLSRIQGSILFFNVACVSILILEYVSRNEKLIIMANVSFNILCTIYAAVTPIVVIIYTPEWTRETIRLWHLISPPSNFDHLDLRTTFGEEMSYSDKNVESKVYFDQFQKNLTKQAMEKSKKKQQRSSSWNNSEHEIFL
ncbi:hypothetical protein GCK72_016484 [Caenorhabditis remanei]|uniref:Uncharacterized protein n=1 Tax=Caenorhabditis remanei TaxID=31234 RepID=A0A6A5G613_CAERE|nr:hypothetical protein GCK72_016484 [Caenorhabditis remanei]KAF1749939.1 hypothetical protein GCK72_016484 [Caenorhabditis remanei]